MRAVRLTPRPQSRRVWVFTTLILTIGTAVSALLAAVTLDGLMQRPSGGGSMTTMLPGAVYAMVTVMKVCVVSGGVAALLAVSTWIAGVPRPEPRAYGLPAWGLAAIALVVSTPWIGAVGAVIAQTFAVTGSGLSLDDLPHISRAAVFVQLVVLVTGALSAGVSLAKHEHPRLVALLGVVAALVLIGLFWQFQFYAHGFDQDTWAPL
jgi:hypothetical protein